MPLPPLDSSADRRVAVQDCLDAAILVGAYSWTFDEGDGAGWAALFLEDGVFASDGAPVTGRAALAALVRTVFDRAPRRTRHLAGSFHYAYGATTDELIVRYYSHVTTWTQSVAELMALCVMTLVRRDGRWMIRRNDTELLLPGDGA